MGDTGFNFCQRIPLRRVERPGCLVPHLQLKEKVPHKGVQVGQPVSGCCLRKLSATRLSSAVTPGFAALRGNRGLDGSRGGGALADGIGINPIFLSLLSLQLALGYPPAMG